MDSQEREQQANKPETNKYGATVVRDFHLHRERYHYDVKRCKASDGWQQYDTRQDAWYFGVWVNRSTRQIMTYAEGDETLETCPTEASFEAQLRDMADFYGAPPPAATTIDGDGTVTHIYDSEALFGRAIPEQP